MRGSAAFRTGVTPGGALAGPWVKNELWRRARAVPSLDLRFADNKSLVDATTGATLVDFSRGSKGTYVGSDGLIKTATTNYLLRSEEFANAAWTAIRANPVDNTATAPNGKLTASTFTATDTDPYILQTVSLPAGTYTFSVYIKAKSGNSTNNLRLRVVDATLGVLNSSVLTLATEWQRFQYTVECPNGIKQVRIDAPDQGSAAGDVVYLWGAQLEQSSTVGEYVKTTSTINSAPRFDHDPTTGESLGLLVEEQRTNLLLNSGTLSTQSVTVTAVDHALSFTGTGTVTLSGASTAGPLVGTGTGEANRVSLIFTPTAGSLTLTVSGTVTDAQLEAGSFPTSYIPTEGTTVTRAADVASISGTNFSSWYNASEGTVFYDTTIFSAPDSLNAEIVSISDGTVNNYLGVFIPSQLNHRAVVKLSGVNEYLANAIPLADVFEPAKVALAYQENNTISAGNGALAPLDTSCTLPTVDQFHLGHPAGGAELSQRIRRLVFWPARLPDSTLQTITN